VFAIGVFTGGIIGVIFSVLAFSAFLFQFLSSLKDAIVALATVVLAIATISLYRATSVLASSTNILATSTRDLAEIERKRERRSTLEKRMEFANELIRIPSPEIIAAFTGPGDRYGPFPMRVASSARGLRARITYNEDPDINKIIPLLDQLIPRIAAAEQGEPFSNNEEDTKAVREWIDTIQTLLKVLVPTWLREIQFQYNETPYDDDFDD
jgi:hypothetical protein